MSLSRKRRFARNLDKLLKARNLTRKEAAAGALVPYQWLRRAVAEGISRIEARNSGHLSSLAEYLGLPGPDLFWDGGLYVEPARDLTEYEAGRIGEMMREYVTLVGPNDGLVRLIVGQLGPAVHQERERKWRLDAVKKAAEEAEAARASGGRLDESLRRWQAYREALGSVLAHGKSVKDLRESGFKATAEDAERARRAVEFFRTQFVDGWRAIGLPHAEEIRLDPWLVAVQAASTNGPGPTDFASVVKGMWMSEYARRLDKTVQEAEDLIRSYVRNAYRMSEGLVAPARRHETPLRGRTGAVVEGQGPAQGQIRSPGVPHVEIPAIVNEALETIRRTVEPWLRKAGLAGIERVTVTPEEVVSQLELPAEADVPSLCGEIMDLVWIPKYAAVAGISTGQLFEFVSSRLNEVKPAAEAMAAGAGAGSDQVPIVHVQSQVQHQDSKLAETDTAPISPAAIETPERKQHARCLERRRVAAQEAAALVATVFAALGPEQASLIHRIYGSRSQAEAWVRAELSHELFRLEHAAPVSSRSFLDHAVDIVIRSLTEDLGTYLDPSDADVPGLHETDEQVAADVRPLESRRRVEHLEDEDLGRPPRPIGAALECLIADCIAGDLSKYDDLVDEVLERLADTPTPGRPRETYRRGLKRLGDPRSLARAALRTCGGDRSKAVRQLVRQVDGWIEDEKARASAQRRSEPAASENRTTQPPRKKKVGVVPLKLIRQPVLGLYRRGADRYEILEALTNDPYLPDLVRKAPLRRLEKSIEQILARFADDGDDWTKHYQDFSPDVEEDYAGMDEDELIQLGNLMCVDLIRKFR